jgi:hypothetical protein
MKGGSLVLKLQWGSAVQRHPRGSVSTVKYTGSTITCQVTVGRIPRNASKLPDSWKNSDELMEEMAMGDDDNVVVMQDDHLLEGHG